MPLKSWAKKIQMFVMVVMEGGRGIAFHFRTPGTHGLECPRQCHPGLQNVPQNLNNDLGTKGENHGYPKIIK